MEAILAEIAIERANQDAKWGEQNHPSVPEVWQAHPNNYDGFVVCSRLGIPTEYVAKAQCDEAAAAGELTWAHVLIEELCEAICAKNETDRRAELIQVAAVAAAQIECIDRRAGYDRR